MRRRLVPPPVTRALARMGQVLSTWVISLHIPALWARRSASALLLFVLLALIVDRYVAPRSLPERTALIQALAQVAGAIGLVFTLMFTSRQVEATNRSVEVARAQLDALLSAYPESLSPAEIADRAGYSPTSSTVGSALGTLRRNGLTKGDGKRVRASETLLIDTARTGAGAKRKGG